MKTRLVFAIAVLISVRLTAQVGDQEMLAERLKQHVSFLASDSLEGRGLGTRGKELAVDYIESLFRSFGLDSLAENGYIQEMDLNIYHARVKGANVIGILKGSDPVLRDEYIVIGAHYDHLGYNQKKDTPDIYHGADDNASGVAAVIELARYFSMNREPVKTSIVFAAFDAEESGLWGSTIFLRVNKQLNDSNIRVMFSLDMIGMYESNNGLILDGMGTVRGGEDIAKTVAESNGIRLKRVNSDLAPQTDTWPFIRKGIPAVHVFTGMKSPYHKPEDTWDKLDYSGLALITGYLADMLTQLSAAPEIDPSGRYARMSKPFAVSFDAGITAGAGMSHHRIPEEYFTPKGIFSYNAGLFVQMNLGDRLTLQPEVLFQGDGSKTSDGKLNRQSIVVPLNLHFNISNEFGGLYRFYPFLGGYYLYGIQGENGEEEMDFEDDYSRNEWGFNLGFGMDLQDWQVKITWRRSLTDLTNGTDERIYPSLWYISLGYKF